MKRVTVLMIIIAFVGQVHAQDITVCFDKTVNLIFPYAIVSEDHGSSGIIAQQRKGAPQILHVKANQKNFTPTSLSVVTSDGNLYSFVVRYAGDVTQLNYVVNAQQAIASTTISDNQQILEQEAAMVINANRNVHLKTQNSFTILRLHGVYATPHALWLKAKCVNRSAFSFAPSFVKFFIRSKRRVKNAAVSEREIAPVYTKTNKLFAFDPFAINRHQQLIMQVGETNGSLLELRIKSRHFRKMRKIDCH